MNSRLSAARVSPPDELTESNNPANGAEPASAAINPLTVLIIVPTLHRGAADVGALDCARILAAHGHHPVVVSQGGALQEEVAASGGELIHADVASKNPFRMARNVITILRLIRERHCSIVHAHGRAPAWSAYLASRIAGVPFLTSWYKGFREQNIFKHFYNGVMARGARVIAASDQIADLINERYGVSWNRIAVVPAGIDAERFDPASITRERVDAVRRAWGVSRDAKVILVVGRMARRKGHHVVALAMQRLHEMGLKDFFCVFLGEDRGRTRYVGELWDLVMATHTTDIIRMTGPTDDLPAAFATANVVVSAATQPEGLQRSILEAQAMARPVVVSDLGAGPEVVLAPPATPEERMTGLRFSSGDDTALAAALIRLFSLPESVQRAVGARGREWVLNHFSRANAADLTLRVYADVMRPQKTG